MGYDIPDEIKYKEKIILNLDLKQLGYAVLFGVMAILAYNLPLEGEFRLVLPAVFALTGLAFAFLNIDEKIQEIIAYLLNIRSAKPEDKKAQNFMGVKAIKNNVIYLDNGELLAILQVQPVNFELLDDERKKSLIANYRGFLNQLTTPIQILIRTVDADLTVYFEAQEAKFAESSKEFSELYTDSRKFEDKFLEENTVRERHYYLIARHIRKKHIGKKVAEKILKLEETELKQLDQQLQIITEKLANCALETNRLENKELTNLLLSYSDCESEEEQQKKEDGKPAPLFAFLRKKRQEKPDMFRFLITPSFEIHPSFAKVNAAYHRIVKVTGYPRNVEDGWLLSFLGKNEGYDISLHIHPSTITQTLVLLHNQIIRQTADLMMSTAKGTPNPALEIKKSDTMKTYEQLYKGEEKLFRVSLYLDNKETDMEALDLLTEKCSANLNALLMIPKVVKYRMAEGIKSALPLGQDKLESQREFLTSPLSATFPFISPASTKRKGIMFAHEEETLNPLFVDFDGMSNKHFFVLGISGSGKSYTAKYLTIQHLMNDDAKVYILDPNAEYRGLARQLNGEVVDLSKDSDSIINVFDIGNEDFGSKMLSLISVFDIISGGLSESQKGILNEALLEVYKKNGIVYDKNATWNRKPPTFSDFRSVLEGVLRKSTRRKLSMEDRSAEVLLNRVRMYTKSGFFGFLDKQTRIDLGSDFIDFDLSRLPSPVKKLMMFVVLDLISREIKKDTHPKVVLIDEGWSLLRSKEAESYMLDFIKTSRKYNTSIGFITQEIEDLLRSDGGKSILNTTSTKILMRQNPSNMELIARGLKLNDSEKDYLVRANKGHGLLITEEGHYRFFTVAPPKIHALITTNPNEESVAIAVKEKEHAERGVKIDLRRGYYEQSQVSEAQADALRKEGYVLHKDRLGTSGGSAYYLVKTQGRETAEHALFCWHLAEELRKRKVKAQVHATKEADVTMRIRKKDICFEVETGENLASNAEDFEKKMDARKREYSQVIILVTKWNLRGKYSIFARTITRAEIAQVLDELADNNSQMGKALK